MACIVMACVARPRPVLRRRYSHGLYSYDPCSEAEDRVAAQACQYASHIASGDDDAAREFAANLQVKTY